MTPVLTLPKSAAHCALAGLGLHLLLGLLLAGLLLGLSARPASAQSNASCQQAIQYLDLNKDGKPEAMLLACQFAPGTHDQLTIYNPSGKLSTDIPWQQNIHYENETWVFDLGSRGRASLIINFRKVGDALVAQLYDDRDQDGAVSYQVNNGEVNITENRYWTVQVTAADGWWVRDGVPNYNLHILVDGDVEGMFMMEPYRRRLVTDGKPDYDIQIYDQNRNGRPEFDKRMILTPWLQDSVGLGTQMMANWVDNELPISGGFSLWPYLDLAHTWKSGSRIIKGYQSAPPPIMFEPATGRIEAIGEFVASRGGENNCFYYSKLQWKTEQLNETDFESPFCFYDLASDKDRIPDLQVRSVYWPPKDIAFLKGSDPNPYELIRYSWDQDNSQTWRYAIGLVGQHLIDTHVSFPGLDVLTIPYQDFPSWVTGHTWDMAVFSEFTGKSYFTSEGNYSVSYPEDQKFAEYFTGKSDNMPSPEVTPDVNFKMEWAMNYMRKPYLYFSPVDYHLHLLGVAGGAWTIDKNHSIQYENIGGGDFINHWVYLANGQPEKSLLILNNISILYEENSVTFQFGNIPGSLFTTPPPADHIEWEKLSKELEQYSPKFDSGDFKAMLAQFGDVGNSITGASLRDFRLIKSGFRFVLQLQNGFGITGKDWLGLKDKSPGEYVVSYDGSFHLQSLTSPSIQMSFFTQQSKNTLVTKDIGTNLQLDLHNNGLEDAGQVTLTLGIAQSGQTVEWSKPQTVAVLAGETTMVSFPWTPKSQGKYTLVAQAFLIKDKDGKALQNSVADAEQIVNVRPAQSTALQQEVSAFGVVAPWQVAALVTVLLLTVAMAVWVFASSETK